MLLSKSKSVGLSTTCQFKMKKLSIFTIFLISISAQHCDKDVNCPEINERNKLEINEINKLEIKEINAQIYEINKPRTCQWAEPGKPSIVVRTTAGRLGNCLFGYLILLGYKVSTNYSQTS